MLGWCYVTGPIGFLCSHIVFVFGMLAVLLPRRPEQTVKYQEY
jgi:hypothetical protein